MTDEIEMYKGDNHDRTIYSFNYDTDDPEDMTDSKIYFVVRPTLAGHKAGYRQLITDAGSGGTNWDVGKVFWKNTDTTKQAVITKVTGTEPALTIEYELLTGTDFADDEVITNPDSETLTINGTPTNNLDPILELANLAGGGDATEIEMTDPTGGEAELHIKPTDTSSLDAGIYFYDIACLYHATYSDVGMKTLAQNLFILKEHVSREDGS